MLPKRIVVVCAGAILAGLYVPMPVSAQSAAQQVEQDLALGARIERRSTKAGDDLEGAASPTNRRLENRLNTRLEQRIDARTFARLRAKVDHANARLLLPADDVPAPQ